MFFYLGGWNPLGVELKKTYLEPETFVYNWLFQLDDEANLYIGNGGFTKHPLKTGCLGYQVLKMHFFLEQLPIDMAIRLPKNNSSLY